MPDDYTTLLFWFPENISDCVVLYLMQYFWSVVSGLLLTQLFIENSIKEIRLVNGMRNILIIIFIIHFYIWLAVSNKTEARW